MYYHFSIILTFYPLIGLRFLDSNISALEVCTDAANAVVTLIRSYESLHGLRRTPCFLPYIIFASGIARLGTTSPKLNPVDTLTQSAQEVAILQIMSLYHGSSKRACRILLSRALYPSSTGASLDKDSEADLHQPWEPFMTTMTSPAADTMRCGPFIEGFTWVRASDHASNIPLEQLRRNGFERML
jgi:hypothetical protein